MYEFLSAIGRKIWGFLDRAIKEEVDLKEYFENAKKLYPNYREYDANNDYYNMKFYHRVWNEMQSVAQNEAFGRDFFAPTYRPTSARYELTFRIKTFNPITGEYEDEHLTAKSDYLHLRRDWEKGIRDMWEKNRDKYKDKRIVIDITPVRGIRGW